MKSIVYVAKHRATGNLIFIRLGENYPQHEYELIYSMSAEQAMQMVLDSQKD